MAPLAACRMKPVTAACELSPIYLVKNLAFFNFLGQDRVCRFM